MTNFHAHFYHGSVKAFRQELDGTSPAVNGGGHRNSAGGPSSASAGKSWTLSAFAPPVKGDPNERDAFGRTVLHLAASATTQQAYTFLTILLRSPNLSVNLQDYESGYTALHRALYSGNIRAARDLLARTDIDVSVKDSEGLTAFDLYNGTVEATNPPSENVDGTDLYVWGVNRNYALGTGDSSDKVYPDRVNLLTQRQASDHPDPAERFFNVGVKDAVMAKLHTGVLTTEARGNLSLCGFGSGGRLGRSTHSQLALLPLPDMPHTFTQLALGQDHTLALTSGGYILSWGSSKFAQLGYTIDPPERPNPFAKDGDELIQTSPKRVIGPLKKEWVRGVAAGRMSSACWTADAVWTWGTNLGHLGYDKAASPTQVLPRKVTAITQPVIDVALSDYTMLCLLDSKEVLCFHHDTNFKINFSSPQRSLKAPRNLNQITMDTEIVKVTSCGQTFATLSKKGDVCTFQLPHPSEEAAKDVRDRHVIVKPQIQWALRKNFTAVRDMALGSDGTIIICTHSGHVFVRQRVKAGAGNLKFRRIPYLQRIVKVATNDSGAFAAIRVDARPAAINPVGKTLEEDMYLLQPHFRRFESQMTAEDFDVRVAAASKQDADEEEDEGSNSVARDSVVATALCQILTRWRATDDQSLFAWSESLLGSDLSLVVGDHSIPAHSVLLSLRSPVLSRLLKGGKAEGFTMRRDGDAYIVDMAACHPLVALLLLQYLYSDDVSAVWDSRVTFLLTSKFADLKLPIADIKADLKRYAGILELAPLVSVLGLVSKSPIEIKTLASDLSAFFASTSTPPSSMCDVVIALEDREVACQSVLLRARVPFFESMFADRDWTEDRRDDGKVVVHMEHLRWRPMKLVFRYIHEGVEDILFDYLHQETLDEFLDFVFEVLSAATELLMDRLVLVCSRVIAKHCNPYNAAALATEASFYQASSLKHSIFDYISACMETMLESGLLDDLDDDVLRDLSAAVSRKQLDRTVVPRSGVLVADLMAKHREWLSLQDIPAPRVRAPIKWKARSPLIQPSDVGNRSPRSPLATPDFKPLQPTSAVDEMFSMDDDVPETPRNHPMTPPTLGGSGSGSGSKPVWKSKTVAAEKVDLRGIMAEAAASRPPRASPATPAKTAHANGSPSLTPSRPGIFPPSGAAGSIGSGGSPWRAVAPATRTSFSAVQSQQATASPSAAALATSPVTNVLSRPAGSQASPLPTAAANRVITPVKQPVSAAPTRRAANGPAWSTPTTYVAAVPPPPVALSASPQAPAQAFSLLAIQQEEVAAAARANQKQSAKSFAEIQAEEHREKAERAREVEFMRWWQEEESRLASYAGNAGASGSGGGGGERGGEGGGRGGRGRGQKRVPHRGGRGGGRGGRGGGAGGGGSDRPAPVGNRDPREARIDDFDVGVGDSAGGAGAAGGSGSGGGGGGGGKGKGRSGGARRVRPPKQPETS